jgi:hypothetical protein
MMTTHKFPCLVLPYQPRGIESPDRADALIGAIVLGQESQIDWREALAFQKEVRHQMQLDYQRPRRGRLHIEWR